MKQRDFFWFVGWYEGEGSIYCPANSSVIRIEIFSIDRDTLERAVELWGGKIYSVKPRGGQIPGNKWCIAGKKARYLAEKIVPYMSVRRARQVSEALRVCVENTFVPEKRICKCGCGEEFTAYDRRHVNFSGTCAVRVSRARKVAA